jgi:predicted RNA-binding Zn-ribbon protein involved in translation (DUF1610 family)
MDNENVIPPAQTIPIRRPNGAPPQQQQIVVPPEPIPQYPTENISLPSKGWFYPESNPLSSGTVELKMMTAREEDILTNQNFIKKGVQFDKLLQSLIIDKSIDYGDIFTMDQNALMMAARRLAYGDGYAVKITCPKCGEETPTTIDLSKLEDKEVDVSKFPKGVNQFDFILPYSKLPVTFKLLCQRDQEQIDAEIKQLHKANKDATGDVTIRLKYILTSVNGNSDKNHIRQFVSTMLSRDARELRNYTSESLPKVDTTFTFECPNCSHSERMDVPLTVQFFYPDA